jgi:hypothetical protein
MSHSGKLPTCVFYNSVEFMSSDCNIFQGDVVGVDDGIRPFVLFFCLSWFQKKEKKQEPRPVYDDEVDDDDEEDNALDPVTMPPPGYTKSSRSQNSFTDAVF